jgi:hypothetical protein
MFKPTPALTLKPTPVPIKPTPAPTFKPTPVLGLELTSKASKKKKNTKASKNKATKTEKSNEALGKGKGVL